MTGQLNVLFLLSKYFPCIYRHLRNFDKNFFNYIRITNSLMSTSCVDVFRLLHGL